MFDIFDMLKKDKDEKKAAVKQVTRETIEEACEVHGVDCDELIGKLNEHLAVKKA